jgi:hypothetical protein
MDATYTNEPLIGSWLEGIRFRVYSGDTLTGWANYKSEKTVMKLTLLCSLSALVWLFSAGVGLSQEQ